MTIMLLGVWTIVVHTIACESGRMFDVSVSGPNGTDNILLDDGPEIQGLPISVWYAIAQRTDFEYALFEGACTICGYRPAIKEMLPLDINTCLYCR